MFGISLNALVFFAVGLFVGRFVVKPDSFVDRQLKAAWNWMKSLPSKFGGKKEGE